MNEFDQYVKHDLKHRYYIRYADDFVFMSQDKLELIIILEQINSFLLGRLNLELHPDKCFIKSLYSGVDFLGFIHFANHRVLRTTTKKRLMSRVRDCYVSSYLGLLRHGNCYNIEAKVHEKIRNHPKTDRLRNF